MVERWYQWRTRVGWEAPGGAAFRGRPRRLKVPKAVSSPTTSIAHPNKKMAAQQCGATQSPWPSPALACSLLRMVVHLPAVDCPSSAPHHRHPLAGCRKVGAPVVRDVACWCDGVLCSAWPTRRLTYVAFCRRTNWPGGTGPSVHPVGVIVIVHACTWPVVLGVELGGCTTGRCTPRRPQSRGPIVAQMDYPHPHCCGARPHPPRLPAPLRHTPAGAHGPRDNVCQCTGASACCPCQWSSRSGPG
jgi:hypothetical protein